MYYFVCFIFFYLAVLYNLVNLEQINVFKILVRAGVKKYFFLSSFTCLRYVIEEGSCSSFENER